MLFDSHTNGSYNRHIRIRITGRTAMGYWAKVVEAESSAKTTITMAFANILFLFIVLTFLFLKLIFRKYLNIKRRSSAKRPIRTKTFVSRPFVNLKIFPLYQFPDSYYFNSVYNYKSFF